MKAFGFSHWTVSLQDLTPKKYEDRNKLPFAKSSFKRYIINLDLSKLNSVGDDSKITNTNTMLNLSELTYTLDSLNTTYNKDLVSFTDNISQRIGIKNFNTRHNGFVCLWELSKAN